MTEPARSGIQRVIKELSNTVLDREIEYRFLSIHTNQAKYVSATNFNRIIENFWLNVNHEVSELQETFNTVSNKVEFKREDNNFYLRIEPSFNKKIIEYFMELPEFVKCVSVVYDAFPALSPEYYAGNGLRVNSYYFRSLLKKQGILTNSKETLTKIKNQIRNHNFELGRIEVAPLGGDHILSTKNVWDSEEIPEIIMLGTLEPRKCHRIALEALKEINEFEIKYRLTIIGSESQHNLDFCRNLREECSTWFSWYSNLLDHEIEDRLGKASILVQLGDEGFGLTVLEAYAKGCFVVFAGTQPACELLNKNATFRLSDISVAALKSALVNLSLNNYQLLREGQTAIDRKDLPSWEGFIKRIEMLFIQVDL
jgi:glycosyltransferase involved in cell wall biosynthesis